MHYFNDDDAECRILDDDMETFLKKMSLNMVNIKCDIIFSLLFLDAFL